MNQDVPVLKDEEAQQPVPTAWRSQIAAIVETLRCGDFEISQSIVGVDPIPKDLATRMSRNVEAYGATLASLPEKTWQSSVCQWMQGHWEVLVDLFDETEGLIDLVLHLRVYELGRSYRFEVRSLHVP